MDIFFIVKEIGWVITLLGFSIIIMQSRKKDIPLIIFMIGVMVILVTLWLENAAVRELLDLFVC